MSRLRRFSAIKIAGEVEKLLSLSELLANPHQELPTPIRILGNGSNVLMDDRGLRGSIILTREDQIPEPKILEKNSKESVVEVSAGLFLPALSRWAAKEGLAGCEYMIGIPGTVGGAVVQNAGAGGQEIKDILQSVQIFDLETRTQKSLDVRDCDLRYRASRFHEEPTKIVLSAKLRLHSASRESIEAKMEENVEYRRNKTPWTRPTLGSTFTRIPKDNDWLYPGRLIEEAGLKGFKQGRMSVSEIHANYIVNEGQASFEEAMQLIETIEKVVAEKTGIQMQREIQIWTDRD